MTYATIIRRKGLGKKSCAGIKEHMKLPITTVRNDEDLPEAAVYFRWGCSSTVPYTQKVINSAKAMHRVTDKRGFRRTLNEHKLCPKSYFSLGEFFNDENHSPVPGWIVRPATHAQGKNLWFCQNPGDILRATDKIGDSFYISDYIPKERELRVFVSQGRVVWMCEKEIGDKSQICWNHNQGSSFKNIRWGNWPMIAAKAAVEAMELSKLHFGGVDVVMDAADRSYVLEINSAPSLPQPYRQSCVAKLFDWMLEHEEFSLNPFETPSYEGWRSVIHPAIWRPEQ